MPRPKGLPKTGARLRGTPNRATEALCQRLATLGCDPREGLAKIASGPATEPSLRVRCFAELAQYVYPKRRAVDLASAEASKMKILVVEYIGSKDGTPRLPDEPLKSCSDAVTQPTERSSP